VKFIQNIAQIALTHVLLYGVVRLKKMAEDTSNFGKVRSFAYGTENLRILCRV